jgi:G3E family GTPase
MASLFTSLLEAPAPTGARLPVTVLTGFLGSGKTTLLNRLLRDPALRRTAVLINEFGSVGLDHDLVQHTQEDMVLLSDGCICCTIRGDLVEALLRLAADPRVAAGQIERVVLETTGLADPAPILHTLMADARLTPRFVLAGVLCTVDACHGAATLARQPEALKQVAVADALALTKTDLADAATQCALRGQLQGLNPLARLWDGPEAALQALRDMALAPSPAPGDGTAALAYRWAGQALGDVNRHEGDISAFAIVRDEPLQREGFLAWLDVIAALRGPDLLRVKGIVHLADSPERPLVIHGVQHLFHPPEWLPAWPGADRRTRIVFITRGVDQDAVDTTLSLYQNRRRRAKTKQETTHELPPQNPVDPGPVCPDRPAGTGPGPGQIP